MNWEALGAIAETLGAIGIIATLFYITSQIRQSTRAIRKQSRREVLEGVKEDTERYLSFGGIEKFSKLNSSETITDTEVGEA